MICFCKEYKIEYQVRVTKYFSYNVKLKATDKHLIKVKELILPTLPADARDKIQLHINNSIKMFA